ncbi:MAG: hypothetical protein A2514_08840 [Gammaproteobacteria bacterium RIFOXYD12_FULL_61_37]|nr:MAG: hypothetical protein A2514_08840 [Gammaproteobacteria bacterium RIFOXYD12_FULL_61_37]
MPDVVFWPLFVTFAAIAIGATLKAVEALQAKKLSDEECSRLRAQLDVLKNPTGEKTIDEQPIKVNETLVPQNERMEKIKDDILVLLSIHPDTQAEFFAQSTKIGNQVALHHLEAMQEKNFTRYYWRAKTWKLQPAGREYLVRHNLIS